MSSTFDTVYADIWGLINRSARITLLTHYKPDGDGISACAALAAIFDAMGKETETIYPNKPEFYYHRHSQRELIGTHSFIPDLIIACDTANYERLYYPDVFSEIPFVNIDHHIGNSMHGTADLVDAGAASVCQVVYHLICSYDRRLLTEFVASALLCGILYDTQVFHTNATSAESLRIAADLVDCGAPLNTIKDELIKHKSPTIISLWGDFFRSVRLTKNGKAAWACITQEDLKRNNAELSGLLGFNNFLAEISNVDVTVLLYETTEGKTKISLRSKFTDVNKLAQKFGGGGHKNAAGILTEQPIDTVAQSLVALLEEL